MVNGVALKQLIVEHRELIICGLHAPKWVFHSQVASPYTRWPGAACDKLNAIGWRIVTYWLRSHVLLAAAVSASRTAG